MGVGDEDGRDKIIDRADVAREDGDGPGGDQFIAFDDDRDAEDVHPRTVDGVRPPALEAEVLPEKALPVAAVSDPDPGRSDDSGGLAAKVDMGHGYGTDGGESAASNKIDGEGNWVEQWSEENGKQCPEQERRNRNRSATKRPGERFLSREAFKRSGMERRRAVAHEARGSSVKGCATGEFGIL